jgi:hypothetical protein
LYQNSQRRRASSHRSSRDIVQRAFAFLLTTTICRYALDRALVCSMSAAERPQIRKAFAEMLDMPRM